MRDDDPVPARGEQRTHAVAQQRLTLQRRAGQHDDEAAVGLKRAGRGRAPVVLQHGAAARQHDLLQVVFGHVGVALAVQAAQAVLLGLIELERDAERAGHDLLGQVVARGAEAAGRDDEVGARAGKLHRLLESRRATAAASVLMVSPRSSSVPTAMSSAFINRSGSFQFRPLPRARARRCRARPPPPRPPPRSGGSWGGAG